MHARPTLLAVASIALGNCLHASVAAPVFTVNSPSDAAGDANPGDGICETAPGSGVCTLRAALQESYITGAVINLPAYTITLQSQIFVGAAPTSLVGFGPGLSVISLQSVAMDGSARIFNLASGATLHLTGIRFTGGMSTGAASTGGAILGTAAAITITNCRFDANRAAIGGGAIYLADANAAVTMTGSTFDGNSSGFSDGGAIYLTGSAAALSITNSTFITNHAGYSGGAIRFYGPSATIADSVFTANQAGYMDLHFADAGHDGGALWVQTSLDVSGSTFTGNSGGLGGAIFGPPISLTGWKVRSSTFDGNTARKGGALYVGRTLDMTNSTLSANESWTNGGGVYLETTATASFYNATLAENISGYPKESIPPGTYPGAGIYNADTTVGSVQITDSLFYRNAESVYNPDTLQLNLFESECYGGVSSTGHNWLVSNAYLGNDNRCGVVGTYQTGNMTIGPLQDNGGRTKTRALPFGNPAVGAGNPGGCTDSVGAPIPKDQRGSSRPFGTNCDLGAFEYHTKGDADGDGDVDVVDVFFLINFLFAGGPAPLGIADVDGTPGVGVGDVFYLINFLFAGGPAPPV